MDYQAFYKISYGLYIISSKNSSNKFTGHISNTVFQVSSEPPIIAICTNKNNLTTEYIAESEIFTISAIQQETDMKFIGKFGFKSGREIDKFCDTQHKIGTTGAPIVLDKTIAYFECRVINTIDAGTHMMYLGKVVESGILNNEAEPLTYSYYRNVIKGLLFKNAPTYIDKKKLHDSISDNKEKEMKKYVCTVCGYVYDPEVGDPDSGIAAGTAFADIPDDWVCPVCGVGKDDFEEQ